MSNVPSDRKYAKSHEWLRLESDGTATVGITDYAQNSLGDITFVQLPKVVRCSRPARRSEWSNP